MTPANEETQLPERRRERRKDWQIIKALVAGQIVTLILALSGLTIAVFNINAKADSIQTSRIDSRRDNCNLLKGLALSAAGATGQKATEVYIKKTPLVDCEKYSHEGITSSRSQTLPPPPQATVTNGPQ